MRKAKIGVLLDSKCYSELIDSLQTEIKALIEERYEKNEDLQKLNSELKDSMDKFSKKESEIEQAKNNISDKKKQIKLVKKNVKRIKKAKMKLVKYDCGNDSKKENKFARRIKKLILNPPLDTTKPLVANFLNTEKTLSISMLEDEAKIEIYNKELEVMQKSLETLESELKKIDSEIKVADDKISELKAILRKIKRYLLLDFRKTQKLNSHVLKDENSVSKENFIPSREKVKQKELAKKSKKK